MKRIFFALTLVLVWQSAAANSQSIAEAARKERERQAAAGNAAPVVRSSAPPAATAGDRTGGRKTDPEVGASITIQPGWEWSPSQNSPANPTLTVHCPGQRTYGCQVQLDSLVIPLNQTQIIDEERWATKQTDRGRVLSE